MWVVKHIYMVTTPGISLYSYLYLKLAKMLCFFLLSLMLSLQQNQRTRGQNRFSSEAVWGLGEVAQIMYTHVSKCKNDKIKFKK
jgi:hypothetical protein